MLAEIESQAESLSGPLHGRVLSDRVMAAVARVPRHEFVPLDVRPFAYLNRALPIGFGKTVSQPFLAALMIDLLEVDDSHRVLEIGTGSGYHAALLAELGASVYTVELIPELVTQAASRLGYHNIAVRMGNGRLGWPEHAPYDRILVTAAAELIPGELLMRLTSGGRIVLPAGIPGQQQLLSVERTRDGRLHMNAVLGVHFAALDEDESLHGSG
ncbi:MAG: protein-L-isoaspartate(D-aspartate) O-methyltransferase [Burkholderiales bacterium]|nr:protein-L-isoaspartate(D-aspartate) O-methyltransferase [Burkholderiales bacterium]